MSDFFAGEEGQERVAADESSLAVDRDHTIPVSVMGDAQVRVDRTNGRRQDREILFERLRISTGEVSVRLRVDGDHVAAHLPQQERRDRRRRTARAVHDDADFRRPHVFEDRLHMLLDQIGPGRDRADVIPRWRRGTTSIERLLDLPLLILIESHAVRIPQLDSVVRGRVVGGRDDRAARKLAGSAGQGRRRDEARVDRGRTRRKDAGGEGLDEHRPGDARIASDDRAPVRFSKDHPDMEGEIGGHVDVPESSNPG